MDVDGSGVPRRLSELGGTFRTERRPRKREVSTRVWASDEFCRETRDDERLVTKNDRLDKRNRVSVAGLPSLAPSPEECLIGCRVCVIPVYDYEALLAAVEQFPRMVFDLHAEATAAGRLDIIEMLPDAVEELVQANLLERHMAMALGRAARRES